MAKKNIDYISDLHLDYYFDRNFSLYSKENLIITFIKKIIPTNKSDILILSGDISHSIKQIYEFISILRKHFYKYVIYTPGNHEHFILLEEIKLYNTSEEKINKLENLLLSIENVYFLYGNIITIENITFGGSVAWYNSDYIYKYFNNYYTMTDKYVNKLWKNFMGEYTFMKTIKNDKICNFESYKEIFNIEIKKLYDIHKNCDVIITHINPSIKKEHQSQQYCETEETTFFCFNGEELLKNTSAKYWFFGHTHDVIEYKYYNVNCFCNPFGYPSESRSKTIKTITLEINGN